MKYLKVFESYYEDLTKYTYGRTYDGYVNIGWLDKDVPFNKGAVDNKIVDKIKNITASESFKGSHICNICNDRKFRTNNNKKVTYKGVTYVFPGLLEHYILDHNYLPPNEFIEAINSL